MGKTWSRGTNSRLPFDVNVNLNLSIGKTTMSSVRASRLFAHFFAVTARLRR